MIRQDTITNWQRLPVVIVGILAGLFWLLAMVHNLNYFFVAAGTSILLVTLIPIAFSKQYDWFCPWSALILAVIYGCTLPSICMSFNLPSAAYVERNAFLDQPVEYFVKPTLMLLAAMILIGVGYFGFPAKVRRVPISRAISPERLLIVCAVCGAISLLSFAAYFVLNGGLGGGLSSKRATISTLDVGRDDGFRQYGYLRHFAKLGNIALLLLTAYWCKFRVNSRSGLAFIQVCILGTLFLVSVAFPFYASSRAAMVWVVVGFIGVLYYMQRSIFNFKTVAAVGAISCLVIFATFVRDAGTESHRSVRERVGRMLLDRHGPDIGVTSHIVQNIPHKLDYKYGKTMAVWLVAPIPRELMPNKPLIHSGPVIGQKIYGLQVSGVPPGIVAELYWNFHLPGVFFGSIIFGAFLRLLYQTFQNFVVDPVILAPVYLYAIFPIAFKGATHSVGPAVVMPLVELTTICIMVYFVTVRTQIHTSTAMPIQPESMIANRGIRNAG